MTSKFRYVFFLSIVFFALMPKFQYPGDSQAIRIFSRHLITTGHPYLVPQEKNELGFFLTHMSYGGNYFVNPRTGNYFSKWGVFNVILYSIPELLAKKINILSDNKNNITFFLNIFNLVWLIFFVVAMLRLLENLGYSGVRVYSYVSLSIFSTYLWYFLRSQTTEVFIIAFFTMFIERAHRFIIKPKRLKIDWVLLLYLFLLILVKNSFILLIPLSYLLIILSAKIDRENLKLIGIEWGLALGFLMLVFLLINFWQYGDFIESGYGQQGTVVPNFSFEIGTALYGFLFSSNRSIFIYFPLLLLSFFEIKAFCCKNKRFYIFISSIFILYLIFFSTLYNWEGEWSYGPRFMVFILPIISIPAIEFLGKKLYKLIFLPLLGLSIYLQYQVVSRNFFVTHTIRYFYKNSINDLELDQYYINNHTGLIIYRLEAMINNNEPDFVYSYLLSKYGIDKAAEYAKLVKFNMQKNFLWFYL